MRKINSIEIKKLQFLVISVGIATILISCSISSNSDSIKSVSDSFNSSSYSNGFINRQIYLNQVSEYTMMYIKEHQPIDNYINFFTGISDLAEKQGINNWDSNNLTYIGIGKGLKKASIDVDNFDFYKTEFSEGEIINMNNIQKGYDSSD